MILEPADLVFCWPQNIGSFLTSLGQGYVERPKPPTHICMVGEDGKSVHTTMAKGLLYGSVPIDRYLKMPYEVYRMKFQDPQTSSNAILAKSRSHFNTVYPLWDLFSMALGVWRKFKKANKLVYCSKAVAQSYWEGSHISLYPPSIPVLSDITPEMLYSKCLHSPLFIKVT